MELGSFGFQSLIQMVSFRVVGTYLWVSFKVRIDWRLRGEAQRLKNVASQLLVNDVIGLIYQNMSAVHLIQVFKREVQLI